MHSDREEDDRSDAEQHSGSERGRQEEDEDEDDGGHRSGGGSPASSGASGAGSPRSERGSARSDRRYHDSVLLQGSNVMEGEHLHRWDPLQVTAGGGGANFPLLVLVLSSQRPRDSAVGAGHPSLGRGGVGQGEPIGRREVGRGRS